MFKDVNYRFVCFIFIILIANLIFINYQTGIRAIHKKHVYIKQDFIIRNLKDELKMNQNRLAIAENKIKNIKKSFNMMNLTERIEFYKRKFKIRNIVAYVFYGRKIYTKILFRYLDRNLKINGGILDKVLICNHLQATKVNITDESIFLNNYLEHHKGYEEIKFERVVSFKTLYTVLHDNDLVFKIDDDIVFISNNTFETMLEEYFNNDHLILSANVVNHHTLSPIHANMKLMVPFYETHEMKWVRSIDKIAKSKESTIRCIYNVNTWKGNPKCGAIAHENFLYHIYQNNFSLSAYNFKLYNFNAHNHFRWRINFILFRGSLVNKMNSMYPNVNTDEEVLTVSIPKKYNKHLFALGTAVVAHFSYSNGQVEYLSKTDILNKYAKLSLDYLKNNKFN
jgi:hypothetical protein